MRMKTATELSLFLENKPGVLAAACRDLARRKINVEAISVVDHIDHALVRMVVSDPRKAIHILESSGALVIATDLIRIDLGNRAGALAGVAQRLARARVNIQYLYGSVANGTSASLYLRVDSVPRARRALARA